MSFSSIRRAVCVLAIVCLSATVAEATFIDVQVVGQSTGNPTAPPSCSGAAVAGTASDVWNGYAVDSLDNGVYSPGVMALRDVTGTGTAATFKLTTAAGDNQAYSPSGQTGNALADSYTFAYTDPTSTGFEITGLVPNSSCDLYLYSTPANWASGDTTFTVNGVVKRAVNSGQFTSVGWVENNDYVHYASLLADASGNVTGTFAPNGVPDHAGFLNGFQLVGTVVPEPSTLALLAAGLIGLAAYGWRKQR